MNKDDDDEYEFEEEWENRDEELSDMSLSEYNESRCIEEYGMSYDDMDNGDND